MTHGEELGRTVCVLLTGCAGCALGFVAAVLFAPMVLMAIDAAAPNTPDEPPLEWMEPIVWVVPACAAVGAVAGALFAWCGTSVRRHAE